MCELQGIREVSLNAEDEREFPRCRGDYGLGGTWVLLAEEMAVRER